MKRMYWFVLGLGTLLLVGAFLAGTSSTHPASAQAPARPAAQRRIGVLTQPAFLWAISNPDQNSIVKR